MEPQMESQTYLTRARLNPAKIDNEKRRRKDIIRKISLVFKKCDSLRTSEERQLLEKYPDIVKQVKKRKERVEIYKERITEKIDEPDIIEAKVEELASIISQAKHLVCYTGAGISTAARIPDYRGSNGIWTLLQKGEEIGEHDLSAANPTYTHMALYEMHRRGILRYVVSQNCDGLHLRSGLSRNALSEIHGNMYIEVCKTCKPNSVYWRLFDTTEMTARYCHKTNRLCHQCAESLSDTIVHFGERGNLKWPLNWAGACHHAERADVILCLGSSLKVLKKYTWLWQMDKPARQRAKICIVNLQWTPKDTLATLKIHGKCDQIMELLMKHLRIQVPDYCKDKDPIFAHATLLMPEELHTLTQPFLKKGTTVVTNTMASETNEIPKQKWKHDADDGPHVNNECHPLLFKVGPRIRMPLRQVSGATGIKTNLEFIMAKKHNGSGNGNNSLISALKVEEKVKKNEETDNHQAIAECFKTENPIKDEEMDCREKSPVKSFVKQELAEDGKAGIKVEPMAPPNGLSTLQKRMKIESKSGDDDDERNVFLPLLANCPQPKLYSTFGCENISEEIAALDKSERTLIQEANELTRNAEEFLKQLRKEMGMKSEIDLKLDDHHNDDGVFGSHTSPSPPKLLWRPTTVSFGLNGMSTHRSVPLFSPTTSPLRQPVMDNRKTLTFTSTPTSEMQDYSSNTSSSPGKANSILKETTQLIGVTTAVNHMIQGNNKLENGQYSKDSLSLKSEKDAVHENVDLLGNELMKSEGVKGKIVIEDVAQSQSRKVLKNEVNLHLINGDRSVKCNGNSSILGNLPSWYDVSYAYSGIHSILKPPPDDLNIWNTQIVPISALDRNEADCEFCFNHYAELTCQFYYKYHLDERKKRKRAYNGRIMVCACCPYVNRNEISTRFNGSVTLEMGTKDKSNAADHAQNLINSDHVKNSLDNSTTSGVVPFSNGKPNVEEDEEYDDNVSLAQIAANEAARKHTIVVHESAAYKLSRRVAVGRIQPGWYGKGYKKHRRRK